MVTANTKTNICYERVAISNSNDKMIVMIVMIVMIAISNGSSHYVLLESNANQL